MMGDLTLVPLVVFDLDGVLVSTKGIHFEALNLALSTEPENYRISAEDHLARFDGMDTRAKLSILAGEGRIQEGRIESIWSKKQDFTAELLSAQLPNPEIMAVMKLLKQGGFTVAVASNSIRRTVETELLRLDIQDLVDFFLSNEDVSSPKPHPEIYLRAMILGGAAPESTTIFEDSNIGRRAALRSGARLIPIDSPTDVTEEYVRSLMPVMGVARNYAPWKAKNMNVLIPMAGAGSRFESAGFTFPKPLIEIRGKTMIETVVRNLNIDARFIFLVQKSHLERYNLRAYLSLLAPGCEIVVVDGVTDGAARTALLAAHLIDNDEPLLIANSDQFLEWDSGEVLYQFGTEGIDGGIVTFESNHPKWSFAKTDEFGFVTEVAEKNPISNIATTGVYFWTRGHDFVRFANQMISKDIRTNGEFYICPVFNEAIAAGLKIRTKGVSRMWGLGTPEDLAVFVEDKYAMTLVDLQREAK